jgi:hypothetical protein
MKLKRKMITCGKMRVSKKWARQRRKSRKREREGREEVVEIKDRKWRRRRKGRNKLFLCFSYSLLPHLYCLERHHESKLYFFLTTWV